MKLIKLTSPELIEEFFEGSTATTVEESCKIVTEDQKFICENGAKISVSKGAVYVEALEAPLELTAKEESSKKKSSSKK